MNERIQELAEQAHEYVASSNAKNLRKVFEKKFAELIVERIVRKIEQEAEIAWAHEQGETSAAMYALSLEILEDFDMELPEDLEDVE